MSGIDASPLSRRPEGAQRNRAAEGWGEGSRSRTVLLAVALVAACTKSDPVTKTAMPPADEVWLSAQEIEKAEVVVALAQMQDVAQAITVGGRIAFDDLRVTHVFSPVTGRVTRVLAQPGQRLKQGAPLVAILSPDVGQAFSDLVKAQADLVAGEADFHRQELLFKEHAASQRDRETAEDNYRRAKAEHERAKQRASMLKDGSLDTVTQEYTLRSFIDGEVIARMVNPGAEVQGQYSGGNAAELFTIGDIKEVWIFADVPEADLPKVRVGSKVQIKVIAYPDRTFVGTVDWVADTVDPVLRTTRLRCILPNEKEELKPEMFATVSIVQPPRQGLVVADDAVVAINDSTFVFVAAGQRPDGRMIFKRRPVTVGEPQGGLVQVLDGIKAGERVVSAGSVTREQPNDEVWPTPEQLQRAHITVATAKEQDVPEAISIGGRLTFDDLRISHIFSPVNGRVTHVLAQLGQRVKRGTPLLSISSPDVGQYVSDVMKAQADLTAAEHEYKRQKELYAAQAGSLRDLEGAEDNWRKAKAELDRAQQKTQLLKAGSVDTVSQEYTLRSSIDGEVIARTANPGLEVQGQYSTGSNVVELFTIGETDRLWVIGDVYEMDLPHINEGDAVEVRVGAYPDKSFHGVVDWVADVLDPVLRTAKVRCIIDNPEHLLKPEMYEAVNIAVPAMQVLAIPRESLMRAGGRTVVFVATGQHRPDGSVVFKERPVVANEERQGDFVRVLSGLKPGETVAVSHALLLLGML